MKFIRIIAVFLLVLSLYARENLTMFYYDDKVYLLDGFRKIISLYNNELELNKEISVKNISSSGFFDFFAVHDPYRSYLQDVVAGVIWQLDENFIVKKSIDIGKIYNISLTGSVLPVSYNSLLTASSEKNAIYLLRNSMLSKIISFDDFFNDFRTFDDELFILFSDRIMVYSTDGIFKTSIPLTNEFTKIRPSKNKIFLYDKTMITSLDPVSKVTKEYKTGRIFDFCLTEKYIIFIPDPGMVPIKVEI